MDYTQLGIELFVGGIVSYLVTDWVGRIVNSRTPIIKSLFELVLMLSWMTGVVGFFMVIWAA